MTGGPYQQTQAQMVGSPARALRRLGKNGLPIASQSEASSGMAENNEMIIKTFKSFCGDGCNALDAMAFAMLCQQCFLIDARFSEANAVAVFQEVLTPGEIHISYQQFEAALEIVARKHCVSMNILRPAVALCAGSLHALTHKGPGNRVDNEEQTEYAAEDVALKIKAQAALFSALCGDEEHSPEEAHDPCSVDPNLALKVKAQAALLEALCVGDDDEEATEVHDIKVKAQDALLRALDMDECSYENAGVDHDDIAYLKAKARYALNISLGFQAHHAEGEHGLLE